MGHPGGMDAGIVAAVGVQHGPLVEGHEIRVKSGQGDALVRQPDLAGRLAKPSCRWPLPATARPVRARTSPEYGDRSHRGGDMPSSPRFSVVTPCMVLQSVGSSESSGRSEWLCPSTKPGQRMPPSRSIVCRESGLVVRGSTAATKPCTPREPQNHGVPMPSTIRALQKSVSNMGCLAERRGNGPERRGSRPGACVRTARRELWGGPCGGSPTARRNARRRRP